MIVDGLPVTPPNLREIAANASEWSFRILTISYSCRPYLKTLLSDLWRPVCPPLKRRKRARVTLDRAGILHQADKAPWHLSAGEKKASGPGRNPRQPALSCWFWMSRLHFSIHRPGAPCAICWSNCLNQKFW